MLEKTLEFELKSIVKETAYTTFELLKIMIPVSIIVKLLKETGVIEFIGMGLSPVMEIVGLPGDYGLVWATAMITNIYGGLIVFFNLFVDSPLTVAQVTVLASMMLLAHNLPVEVRITQKAGVRLWFMVLLRILCAFILGLILHILFSVFHLFQTENVLLWSPGYADPSLVYWILGELRTYLMIFVIIFGLMVLMKILKITKVIDRLNTFLAPGLKHLGMSKQAAPITIIGMTLGLAYGGGLIIQEVKTGLISKKDTFLSLSLMGLSHSLIEDTLLLLAIGASLAGVLLARVVFSIIVIYLLIKVINRMSRKTFQRFFITKK